MSMNTFTIIEGWGKMGYGGKWALLTKWLARDKLFHEISSMKAC